MSTKKKRTDKNVKMPNDKKRITKIVKDINTYSSYIQTNAILNIINKVKMSTPEKEFVKQMSKILFPFFSKKLSKDLKEFLVVYKKIFNSFVLSCHQSYHLFLKQGHSKFVETICSIYHQIENLRTIQNIKRQSGGVGFSPEVVFCISLTMLLLSTFVTKVYLTKSFLSIQTFKSDVKKGIRDDILEKYESHSANFFDDFENIIPNEEIRKELSQLALPSPENYSNAMVLFNSKDSEKDSEIEGNKYFWNTFAGMFSNDMNIIEQLIDKSTNISSEIITDLTTITDTLRKQELEQVKSIIAEEFKKKYNANEYDSEYIDGTFIGDVKDNIYKTGIWTFSAIGGKFNPIQAIPNILQVSSRTSRKVMFYYTRLLQDTTETIADKTGVFSDKFTNMTYILSGAMFLVKGFFFLTVSTGGILIVKYKKLLTGSKLEIKTAELEAIEDAKIGTIEDANHYAIEGKRRSSSSSNSSNSSSSKGRRTRRITRRITRTGGKNKNKNKNKNKTRKTKRKRS